MNDAEFANYLGIIMKNDSIVGEMGKYKFCIVDYQLGYFTTKALIFVFKDSLNRNIVCKIKKQINKVICRLDTFTKENDTLIITLPIKIFKYKDEVKYIEECRRILDSSIQTFKNLNLLQDTNCFICGKDASEGELSKRKLKHCYVLVHEHCANELIEKSIHDLNKNNLQANRLPN